MEVIQLKNPRALMLPPVQALLRRATGSIDFVAPGGFDTIARDVFEFVTNDNYFMLLGQEGGEWKSVVMGFYPSNNMFPYPTVVLLYNEGTPALRKATMRKLLDILVNAGYTSAWAVNGTKHSDAAWSRLFELPGTTKAHKIGSVMEIKVS